MDKTTTEATQPAPPAGSSYACREKRSRTALCAAWIRLFWVYSRVLSTGEQPLWREDDLMNNLGMPIKDWPSALNYFSIVFEGRVPV